MAKKKGPGIKIPVMDRLSTGSGARPRSGSESSCSERKILRAPSPESSSNGNGSDTTPTDNGSETENSISHSIVKPMSSDDELTPPKKPTDDDSSNSSSDGAAPPAISAKPKPEPEVNQVKKRRKT